MATMINCGGFLIDERFFKVIQDPITGKYKLMDKAEAKMKISLRNMSLISMY